MPESKRGEARVPGVDSVAIKRCRLGVVVVVIQPQIGARAMLEMSPDIIAKTLINLAEGLHPRRTPDTFPVDDRGVLGKQHTVMVQALPVMHGKTTPTDQRT